MKILLTASEVAPYIMTGGLGEVAGALPVALAQKQENDVRVILPLYGRIKENFIDELEFVGYMNVQLAWRYQYCGVFQCVNQNVTYYFLDNEYYFKRSKVYGEYDDAERFAFFSKSVLASLKLIDFYPDIIQANDWQTALVPIYLKLYYSENPYYSSIKTLFTIHNIQYQGVFGKEIIWDVFDIPKEKQKLVEYDGAVNLMKGAITVSDYINTVSPSYAEEIQDAYYAHGLEWALKDHNNKLKGILNGIDTVSYDPQTDKTLDANYSSKDTGGKETDKEALQKKCGLQVSKQIPLIGMVTRLVSHKGLDLLEYIADDLMKENIQLVILGTGDEKYEESFAAIAARYKGRMSVNIQFDGAFSRMIYAGADMFLMPSKSEPCGLSQMIALRYGSVPIVRETGGLKDSISDYGNENGNGFTFKTYNAHDMLGAMQRAIGLYENKEAWGALVKHNMELDLSWSASAKEYMKLYESITGKQSV